MTSEALPEIAARAYVYGFPLVFNPEQVDRYTREGIGANPAAAFNTFSHARTLAGPADTFVTINNDTLYSTGSFGALITVLGVFHTTASLPAPAVSACSWRQVRVGPGINRG